MKWYDFLLTKSLLSLFSIETWVEFEKCEKDDRVLYEQCKFDFENSVLRLVFNLSDSNKFTLRLSLTPSKNLVSISSKDFLKPYFYGYSYRGSIIKTLLNRCTRDIDLPFSDIIGDFSKIGSDISNLRRILLSKYNFVEEIRDYFNKVYFSKFILKGGKIFPPITSDSILYSLYLMYRVGILSMSKEFSVDYISRIILLGLFSYDIINNGGIPILTSIDFFLNLPIEKLDRIYNCFIEFKTGINLLKDGLEDKYGYSDVLEFNFISSKFFDYIEEKLIFDYDLLNALESYDRF